MLAAFLVLAGAACFALHTWCEVNCTRLDVETGRRDARFAGEGARVSFRRTFASDSPKERRGDAMLALIDAGLSPSEIAALTVGDVRIFGSSATVRLAGACGVRYVRIYHRDQVRDLSCFLDRDAQPRSSAPLFPGRTRQRGMSVSRIYQLLEQLREPNIAQEGA